MPFNTHANVRLCARDTSTHTTRARSFLRFREGTSTVPSARLVTSHAGRVYSRLRPVSGRCRSSDRRARAPPLVV